MNEEPTDFGPGTRIISKKHPELGFGVVKMQDENALGDIVLHVSFEHADRPFVLSLGEAQRVGAALDDLRAARLGHVAVFRRKLAAGIIFSENNRNGAFLKVSTQPLPHQAFLWDKVLSGGLFGHVLADDVGMGKTIETGLLITSVLQEGRDRRVLIVCPKGLAVQWQDELEEHFGLFFSVMGEEFKGKMATSWRNHPHVIAPIDRLKREDYADALRQAGEFDLVVCDEAHKLSAKRGMFSGNLEKTANYRLFERLISEGSVRFVNGNDGAPRSPRLLLLSATPHQGDDERFVYLLHLARPDLFPTVSGDQGGSAELLQSAALVETITRTPKSRAVHWDGKPLFKGHETHTLSVEWTAQEQAVSELLTSYIQTSLTQASPAAALVVQLVMHTFHKIAASSWTALAQTLEKRLLGLSGQTVSWMDGDDENDEDEELFSVSERANSAQPFFLAEAAALGELIAAIGALEQDSKWEKCAELLRGLDTREPAAKVLFFTQYRATQISLFNRLKGLFPEAMVELIHGDVEIEERKAARVAFETGSRFLVSTEAGGEGINLQKACHLMVNFDLPWNPMRLQQRIGRLDRYGQKTRVHVFNLMVPASWDHRISTRILERLASIQASMGIITAEVEDYREMLLGAVADQINATELFRETAARGSEVVTDIRIDGWVKNAFASMDRWKQVFTRDLGMPTETARLAPRLTSDDLREAFALAAEQHGIQLKETRTSENKYIPEVYHFRRPEAFRGGAFRASQEVYVTFDRERYAEVRNEVVGKARGQEIKPMLAGFGDGLTDWIFETAFAARENESAFCIQASKLWPHGRGVLYVFSLRWLGRSRRLNAPDSVISCFQPIDGEPHVVAIRDSMELAVQCTAATGTNIGICSLESARKLAQSELRELVATKDSVTRGTASLALLMAVQVEG